MANDILNIVVQLGGEYKDLKALLKQQKINLDVHIKSDLSLNKPLNDLLQKQKSIKLIVDSSSAIKEISKITDALEAAKKLSVLKIEAGKTPEQTLHNFRVAELNARSNLNLNPTNISEADAAKRLAQARQLASVEEAIANYRQKSASYSNITPGVNHGPQKQLEEFRAGYESKSNIDKANTEFKRRSLFANADNAKAQAAFNNNILPSQITANRNPFQRSRYTSEQSIREIAFAGLFGRGITGKAGGVLGGIAGTFLGGQAGTFPGAAAGQIAADALAENFTKLTEAMNTASESGLQFQKSVVAISAVLQSTSDIYVGGEKLDDLQQIQAQQQRAENFQIAARKYLVPIGIAGQNEAAYAQAIATGVLGRKGINLSSEQFGKFAGALGSAQVALRSDLSNNPTRLLKDLEDITAGAPAAQRTSLGIALGGITKEIGAAKTAEDIERLTERLNKFRIAIESSDKASVQLLRLSGAFDQLNTVFGNAREQGKTEGYKGLADSLSTEGVQDNLKKLGEAVGAFENVFLTGATPIIVAATAAVSDFFDKLKIGAAFLGINLPSPSAKPEGEAKQNLRTQLDKLYESIGLDPGAAEKEEQKNPFRIQAQLEKAKKLIGNKGEYIDDYASITKAQFGNIEDIFKANAQAKNDETLTGKNAIRDLFKTKIFDQRKNLKEQAELLQEELNHSKTPSPGHPFGIEDQDKIDRIEAKIKNIDQKKGVLDVEEQKNVYAGGLKNEQFSIEETKKLGDAQKKLSEISQDQADKFRDLTLSVTQAKEGLRTFNDRVENTLASKEEQFINLQNEISDLEGNQIRPYGPDEIKQAKLASLSNQANVLSQESGGGGISTYNRLGIFPGLGIGQTDALHTGFEQEHNGLTNTIKDSERELGDLNRQFKELSETLQNLIKLLKYNLGIKTSDSSDQLSTNPIGDTSEGNFSGDEKSIPNFVYPPPPKEEEEKPPESKTEPPFKLPMPGIPKGVFGNAVDTIADMVNPTIHKQLEGGYLDPNGYIDAGSKVLDSANPINLIKKITDPLNHAFNQVVSGISGGVSNTSNAFSGGFDNASTRIKNFFHHSSGADLSQQASDSLPRSNLPFSKEFNAFSNNFGRDPRNKPYEPGLKPLEPIDEELLKNYERIKKQYPNEDFSKPLSFRDAGAYVKTRPELPPGFETSEYSSTKRKPQLFNPEPYYKRPEEFHYQKKKTRIQREIEQKQADEGAKPLGSGALSSGLQGIYPQTDGYGATQVGPSSLLNGLQNIYDNPTSSPLGGEAGPEGVDDTPRKNLLFPLKSKRKTIRAGESGFLEALKNKYFSSIKGTDQENFKEFIGQVKDPSIRDVFLKWRNDKDTSNITDSSLGPHLLASGPQLKNVNGRSLQELYEDAVKNPVIGDLGMSPQHLLYNAAYAQYMHPEMNTFNYKNKNGQLTDELTEEAKNGLNNQDSEGNYFPYGGEESPFVVKMKKYFGHEPSFDDYFKYLNDEGRFDPHFEGVMGMLNQIPRQEQGEEESAKIGHYGLDKEMVDGKWVDRSQDQYSNLIQSRRAIADAENRTKELREKTFGKDISDFSYLHKAGLHYDEQSGGVIGGTAPGGVPVPNKPPDYMWPYAKPDWDKRNNRLSALDLQSSKPPKFKPNPDLWPAERPDWDTRSIEGRASGGPVEAGKPYKVGEEGEELFVPGTGGVIVNHSMTKQLSEKQRAIAGEIYQGLLGSGPKSFGGPTPRLPGQSHSDDMRQEVNDIVNGNWRKREAENAGVNGFRSQNYYTQGGAGGGTNSTEAILKALPSQIGVHVGAQFGAQLQSSFGAS